MTVKNSAQGMLDTYLFECEQLLEQIQQLTLQQKDNPCFEKESIHEIFRSIHTIKGISAMMMYDEITKISHKLEDVLGYFRETENKSYKAGDLAEQILRVTNFINEEMTKIANGEEADGKSATHIEELNEFINSICKDNWEKETVTEENKEVQPQQFYIPPKTTGNSNFYKIHITFRKGLNLANVHAYKIVHTLKEIAEDMIHV